MKIGMVSLGCPKNLVDSEVMLGLARAGGHEITREAAEADVLIVNTCAFVDRAKQESIDAILELAEHKKTGACTRLVVTGCLAERYRDELRDQIPEIDALLGTGEVDRILGAIAGRDAEAADAAPTIGAPAKMPALPLPVFRANGEPLAAPSAVARTDPGFGFRDSGFGTRDSESARRPPTYLYDHSTPRLLATPGHYAYVKIAEGCDYKCSFCIIPALRGKYRSRPLESIVREAESLAERGVKELLLVSQDTTFYGIDRGERGALARLLRALDRIDGLEWIRLLYLYPTTIGDDVLDAMAACRKVCRYVDLPLQHASNAVLKRMRRPGTAASYARLLDRIRTRIPGVTLRTTFIVGFPGETDAEFAELERFVRAQAFDHVGVFTYSHEEGTAAYRLPDDVPARLKRSRRARLMRLQRAIVSRAHRARLGRRVRVLVDGVSPEHELVLRGRLEGQAPDIDSAVYLSECDPTAFAAGQSITAEIVGSRGYDLVAVPVSGVDAAEGRHGLEGALQAGPPGAA